MKTKYIHKLQSGSTPRDKVCCLLVHQDQTQREYVDVGFNMGDARFS